MKDSITPLTDKYEAVFGRENNFAKMLERELNVSNSMLKEISADMERIANNSVLPDGDHVTISVVTWASEWAERLKRRV